MLISQAGWNSCVLLFYIFSFFWGCWCAQPRQPSQDIDVHACWEDMPASPGRAIWQLGHEALKKGVLILRHGLALHREILAQMGASELLTLVQASASTVQPAGVQACLTAGFTMLCMILSSQGCAARGVHGLLGSTVKQA